MDLIYDIVGTIIFVSVVAVVILAPFIVIWRGIMIQKKWGQVEVTVIGHDLFILDRTNMWAWSRTRINIEYTIEDSVYESFYYTGRARHHLLPPVGTREIRYYNPQNPNKTFSKEDCISMIRSGILGIILGCSFAIAIFLILR